MSYIYNKDEFNVIEETETHVIVSPRYTTMPAAGFDPSEMFALGSAARMIPWQPQLAFLDNSPLAYPTPVPPQDADPTNDTYYSLQWHFGYMGDIEKIWEEYNGAGVHVGVYDDGLQYTHPDLAANYDPSLEVTVEEQIVDPLWSTLQGAPHGTSVAGLIAAANNGIGTVGVAWGASLTGVNIFSGSGDINNNYSGFLEAVAQTGNFDIVNHSWGKFPGFWQDGVTIAMDQSLIDRWFDALENGRNGLGTIVVKAAGNADQNSNGDGSGVTRATIVVGAYDDDGDASYYSSYGSNLLVSGPSSGVVDFFLGAINKGQVTTDIMGDLVPGIPFGYNGLPDTDYTNGFGGTSGATPLVSGVVALMLSANPDLGWRDVQNILAYSAHEIGSGVGGVRLNGENNVWKYNNADNWNGGGLHYSEDYGFGGVDAYNAVRMAEVWTLFDGPKTSANESSFKQTTTDSVLLLDGKTTDIHFTFGGPDFIVDFVDITINLSHTKLDDLEISLISPDGTVTSLVDFRFELSYQSDLQNAELTFGANAFRGENGAGEWTIRIADRWLADEGTLNSASITLHGTDVAVNPGSSVDDVYHFTDEVFKTIARDGTRVSLQDADGGTDWLDMSAMTGNLLVRMQQGNTSNVGGVQFLSIATGTEIENLVTGDGNDSITGSRGDNKIYGMRGDDNIFGADGNDLISGGAGNDILKGGIGTDIFLFDRALNAATNVDTITDFNLYDTSFYGADKIWLDVSIFTGLALGVLDANAFTIGAAATDSFNRVVYDEATGALYFDVDGVGGQAQIKFAQFTQFATVNNGPHPTLSFNDFAVVDTSNSVVTGVGTDRDQADAPTTSTSVDTPNLLGTSAPINGTQYDDEIIAKDGNETINGLAGNDLIAGGGGNDVINGGAGFDQLFGQDGDDIIRGDDSATSTTSPDGDEMYGGDGNDTMYGSAQQNYIYNLYTTFGGPGDWLIGEDGDDVMYGYDGNDQFDGGSGNNRMYGGAGSDYFIGGAGNNYMDGGDGSDIFLGGIGDDTFIVGKGVENIVYGGDQIDRSVPELSIIGHDTVVFEGNFADYKMTGGELLNFSQFGGLKFENTTVGSALADQDITFIEWQSIERLVFADQEINLVERPIGIFAGDLTISNNYVNAGTPVTVTASGWESVAIVMGAGDVTITDIAAVDELDYVHLFHVNGETNITSDALETLDIRNVTGSLTVHAAAGERHLDLRTYALRLDANEKLSDDTATSVDLTFFGDGVDGTYAVPSIATAAVNGANLSFQSAETIRLVHSDFVNVDVRWDIRNATTIDLREPFRLVHEVFGTFKNIFGNGNVGTLNVLTPIDDSILGVGGGSAEFQYIGLEIQGRDLLRLGNLGEVNASNDGTVGPESTINAGLGFRGTISLGGGQDEVRILGSDAFQGGTIDGGYVDPAYGFVEADVIRMTFGVAGAIGDISGNISNFEILHLTATSQSHTADVTHFDSLQQIVISSTSQSAGTNTVSNIVDGSTVTLKTAGDFDALENNLGTINLEMAGAGSTLNLAFQGIEADGADVGHITVSGATTVSISGDNLDYVFDRRDFYGNPIDSGPATDPFTEIALDLQGTTTVYVTGETGWDFTTPGTNIGDVTLMDGSAITIVGALSGITAKAQNSAGVTFIGGAGDDIFEGGSGADVLSGGAGNDTYIINSGSAGDTITEAADGGSDTIQSGISNIDLNAYANIENGKLTGSADYSITGTSGKNTLAGNSGNNTLDGGAGADTAVFTGNRADYTIVHNSDGSVTVTDVRDVPQDGSDTLIDIEYLRFADGRHSVNPAAPTNIQLSNYTVVESSFENLLVGKLSATDAEDDTATFELVDSSGGRFKLVNGNEIRTVYHTLLDYEQQTTYDIKVQVTDGDGLAYEKTLTINLIDTNPEYMVGRNDINTDDIIYGGNANDFLAGNGGNDILRGNGGADILRGGNGDDTAEYSGNFDDYIITYANKVVTITDKRSNPDGTGFDGIDTLAHFGVSFNGGGYEDSIEHLKFADRTVDMADFIAPTDMALSTPTVSEGAASGTVVGTLTTTDYSDVIPGVVTETFTYALLDDAGGRFAIDGDKLVVKAGAVLDDGEAHTVKVRVTDSDGHTFDKEFTIEVVEDEPLPVTVTLSNTLLELKETASTSQPIKVADIVLAGASSNYQLSVTGRDAALFQIIGMALFLKAGVLLDAAQAADLQVAVVVDDDAIAGSPDGVSATYTLEIEDDPSVGMVHGTPASETIQGTSGNDHIDGHGGSDAMFGGSGDDTYIVDDYGDKVHENANEGTDTVISSGNYILGANVENVTLVGDASFADGNDLDNRLIGNAGNNVLSGLGGNDYLDGGAGADQMFGGTGNDTYVVDNYDDAVVEYVGEGNDTVVTHLNHVLEANVENVTLTGGSSSFVDGNELDNALIGNDGDNVLSGLGGNDHLDGGAGADQLFGGTGNDTYVLDSYGDVVVEHANEGTDTVLTSLNHVLGANVENLTLTGSGSVFGDGNVLNNVMTGNSGANVLTGGAGADTFVFNTSLGNGNIDTLADFNVADDVIHLDQEIFAGIGALGELSASAFHFGSAAGDGSDRIVYNKDTGALYFDADGSGSGEQVQFAQLAANLNLTEKDFFIV